MAEWMLLEDGDGAPFPDEVQEAARVRFVEYLDEIGDLKRALSRGLSNGSGNPGTLAAADELASAVEEAMGHTSMLVGDRRTLTEVLMRFYKARAGL